MVRYAKLNLPVDVKQLQSEVAALSQPWSAHFNTKHYEGEWTVLSLRAPGGRSEQIIPDLISDAAFADTPLMPACPSVQALLRGMHCPVQSVRLLNLKSGAVIRQHRDHELAFEMGEARLHFPVFTNAQVAFFVEEEVLPMQEGECWYINANLPHRVSNHGPTDRIHLVIDCKVNDWLKAVFDRGQKNCARQETDRQRNAHIIAELRAQGNERARRLADEMEGMMNNGTMNDEV